MSGVSKKLPRTRMADAAVRFRNKTYFAEYHCDALSACIEDPAWPESHAELERIIDEGWEPIEFGRAGPAKSFHPMPPLDQRVRADWYFRG